MDNQQK